MIRLGLLFVLGLGIATSTAVHADEPKPSPATKAGRPGYHGVGLTPTVSSKRPLQEVTVLLETPHLKLAMITLRDGKMLDAHSTPMPVTIQALRGRGIVQIGDAREPISADRMVFLAPGMSHAVVPDGKAELVLLVHHLKPAPGRGRAGR